MVVTTLAWVSIVLWVALILVYWAIVHGGTRDE